MSNKIEGRVTALLKKAQALRDTQPGSPAWRKNWNDTVEAHNAVIEPVSDFCTRVVEATAWNKTGLNSIDVFTSYGPRRMKLSVGEWAIHIQTFPHNDKLGYTCWRESAKENGLADVVLPCGRLWVLEDYPTWNTLFVGDAEGVISYLESVLVEKLAEVKK